MLLKSSMLGEGMKHEARKCWGLFEDCLSILLFWVRLQMVFAGRYPKAFSISRMSGSSSRAVKSEVNSCFGIAVPHESTSTMLGYRQLQVSFLFLLLLLLVRLLFISQLQSLLLLPLHITITTGFLIAVPTSGNPRSPDLPAPGSTPRGPRKDAVNWLGYSYLYALGPEFLPELSGYVIVTRTHSEAAQVIQTGSLTKFLPSRERAS